MRRLTPNDALRHIQAFLPVFGHFCVILAILGRFLPIFRDF
jgi:hypothetical protein